MFKSSLVCIILLSVIIRVTGQDKASQIPKELLVRIQKSQPDTNRVKLLLQLGTYYLNKQGEHKTALDSALNFFNQAGQLSNSLHSEKFSNQSLQFTGAWYMKTGDLKRCKATFMKVIDHYRSTGDKYQEGLAWSKQGDCIPIYPKSYIPDKIQSYEQARSLFQQSNHKLEEIDAFKNIADAHLRQDKLDQSEAELLQVLAQYKAIGYKKLHYTYDLLAEVSKLKVDLHNEINYRLELIKSMEATADTAQADYYYAKLALVYADNSMYDQSVKWIKKAMLIIKKRGQTEDYYGDLSLLIYDLIIEKKPKEALVFLQRTLKEVPPTNTAQKVDLQEAFGNCYAAMKQYDKAEQYYLEMMRLYKVTNFSKDFYTTNAQMVTDYIHYYETMGGFYILTKKYEKADYYLNSVLQLPKGTVRPITLSRFHMMQFKVDSATGKYISAINHFEQHKRLNDSLYNAIKSKQIAEMQAKYENTQSILKLQNQSRVKDEELQKVNTQRNITLGGVAMLLIIAGLAYNGYRNKQQSNLQMQIKQKEINQQNVSLQSLLNEKDWLLKEVHHRVKNNLQIVMSLLNTQSAFLKNNAALAAIRESQHRVQAISLIHQKLYRTSSVALIDMPAYISELINYLRDCFSVADRSIHFEQQIGAINLDVAQAVPVGLILNEAITNAIKYAFPTGKEGEISISLQHINKELLRLTITDNGKGLPANFDIKTVDSLGMELMKALSEQLGGSFDIKNNNGVCIIIEFQQEKALYQIQKEQFYN